MNQEEKKISYQTSNSYSTLNKLGAKTKNVWIVLHGIGYLSRYFLKYFSELSTEENYIIAPQAPSKYYLNNTYKHVGSSWLTKEKTADEIINVMSYLDEIVTVEQIPENVNLILFGYSQGVSIATRWAVKNKINCTHLILYAGAIPNELKPEDFEFITKNKTEVIFILGNKDPYISKNRLLVEQEKIEFLFKGKAKQINFDGGHEVKKEIINSLVQ